jgi:acyl carrier protein
MSEPVIEVVQRVLVQVRNVDPAAVVPEALLIDDLGADSLDAIEIILALEEHYDREFDGEDVENIKSVGDIVALVETLTQQD